MARTHPALLERWEGVRRLVFWIRRAHNDPARLSGIDVAVSAGLRAYAFMASWLATSLDATSAKTRMFSGLICSMSLASYARIR